VEEKADTMMKTAVFWDVMPCTVYFIKRFRETYCH